jgi:hypothetical protein
MKLVAQLAILYHDTDINVKAAIIRHLAVLQRQQKLRVWEKGLVMAGENQEALLMGALDEADIVLFLVSSDAVASDKIWKEEVGRALVRHKKGTLIFIPVLVRPCQWEDTDLGKIKPLPVDGKPISKWEHLDDPCKEIADFIKEHLARIDKQKRNNTQHGIVPPDFQEIDLIFQKMPDEKVMKHMSFADYEGKPASVAHFAIFSEMLRKIRTDMSEREEYRFYVDNLVDGKEVENIAKAIKERADLLKIDTIELGGICKELLDASVKFREDFGTPDNASSGNWEKAKVRYIDPFCDTILKIEKKLDILSRFSANIDLSDISPN